MKFLFALSLMIMLASVDSSGRSCPVYVEGTVPPLPLGSCGCDVNDFDLSTTTRTDITVKSSVNTTVSAVYQA